MKLAMVLAAAVCVLLGAVTPLFAKEQMCAQATYCVENVELLDDYRARVFTQDGRPLTEPTDVVFFGESFFNLGQPVQTFKTDDAGRVCLSLPAGQRTDLVVLADELKSKKPKQRRVFKLRSDPPRPIVLASTDTKRWRKSDASKECQAATAPPKWYAQMNFADSMQWMLLQKGGFGAAFLGALCLLCMLVVYRKPEADSAERLAPLFVGMGCVALLASLTMSGQWLLGL